MALLKISNASQTIDDIGEQQLFISLYSYHTDLTLLEFQRSFETYCHSNKMTGEVRLQTNSCFQSTLEKN